MNSMSRPNASCAEWIAWQPEAKRAELLNELAPTEKDKDVLEYLWPFWARPKQLPPEWAWRIWLLLAGRGFGKTRCITEWARDRAHRLPGSRGAMVARTAADVRDVLVEGESGILAVSPKWFMPRYEPSKRRLTWPNGSTATLYSADQPDLLRGPQHHWAICDEMAAWCYIDDTWANLMLGLRLGNNPQCAVATTPRPIPTLRKLLVDPTVAVTRGSTYENRSNLALAFFTEIIQRYEGSRLGRQELNAELLENTPGALWTRDTLESTRVKVAPDLARIVVAIDPAMTANEESSETGIIVAGVDENKHGYVLDDVTLRASPAKWAEAAVLAFDKWNADRIVAEVNAGGDMIEYTVKMAARHLHSEGKRPTPHIPFKQVRASRGKHTRAEPVSTLYEQGRCHHVGMFAELEDQMCTWVPGESSPDRMDAGVWAFTDLLLTSAQSTGSSNMDFYGN